jgi:serine protease Do
VDRNKLSNDHASDEEGSTNDNQPQPSKLGLGVHSITPEQAERLGVPEGKGVIVTEVKPGSFADDLNFQPGIVILQVNRQPVNSEDQFRKIASQLQSGQDVVFLVRAGRGAGAGTAFLSGTLP